jgi:hypothetical protein
VERLGLTGQGLWSLLRKGDRTKGSKILLENAGVPAKKRKVNRELRAVFDAD